MFYHGTTKSSAAPYAHADKHTFWVYPPYMKPCSEWDTQTAAIDYCNNHISEGPPSQDVRLKQYVCLGHTSKYDMSVARLESSQFKHLSVEYPRLSAMFGSLIERIETLEAKLKEYDHMVERLEALESKTDEHEDIIERLEALESKAEDDDIIERLEALESKAEEAEEAEADDADDEQETVKDIVEEILEEAFKEPVKDTEEEPVKAIEEDKIYEVEEVSCNEIHYLLSAIAILFTATLVYYFLPTGVRSDLVVSSREIDL
jgi:hypothetical protein